MHYLQPLIENITIRSVDNTPIAEFLLKHLHASIDVIPLLVYEDPDFDRSFLSTLSSTVEIEYYCCLNHCLESYASPPQISMVTQW